MKTSFNHQGFVALGSVLIFSSIILIVSVTAAISSVVESQMSLSFQQSHQSLSLANLCAEKAIWELIQDDNYEGDQHIIIGDNQCYIYPIEWWGEEGRIVLSRGVVSDYQKIIRVRLSSISPEIEIYSWEDVLD